MPARLRAKTDGLRPLAALVGSLMLGALAFPALAQKSSITFGSTQATSSNFALAVAMSKAIKQALPNTNVNMIETGASVDNIRRMLKNEIDFGLVMADTTLQAAEGVGPFQGKPVTDLGVLYVYDLAVLNIAVRADSGVTTLKDLHGKKFSAGIRGSGTELLTRGMFAILGIEPQWLPGSLSDAVEGIQNRQIVGYSKYGVGFGADATLRELMTSTQMRLLSIGDEDRQKIKEKVKGVDFIELPSGIIPGQGAVMTPSVYATYSARISTMDDETAFAIAKAIYDNKQLLVDTFPHLKDLDYRALALKSEDLGLKLHPGAKKFYLSLKGGGT